MKIKFPFFSKKSGVVCTTKQVYDEKSDKTLDKLLADNSDTDSEGIVPITINGKNPIEYAKDVLAMPVFAGTIKEVIDNTGLSYLYSNEPIDVNIRMISENSAKITLSKVFAYEFAMSVETETETQEIIVGECVFNNTATEYVEDLVDYIEQVVHPEIQNLVGELSGSAIQSIFDYLDSLYSQNS